MTATTVNNRKFLASGALVVIVAAGAYGLGRVYPPLGPSQGTIAPAERYVAAQVGEGDSRWAIPVPQLIVRRVRGNYPGPRFRAWRRIPDLLLGT